MLAHAARRLSAVAHLVLVRRTTTRMKYLVSHFLWIAGVLFLLAAFTIGFFTSLPHTDPSLEELARLRSHWHTAFLVAITGIALLVFGIRGVYRFKAP